MRRQRWRMAVRVRLTLLYSGLFAACGAILVAITYGLLAANLPEPKPDAGRNGKPSVPADFAAACAEATSNPYADPALLYKCKAAYQEGVKEGATNQRQATLDQLLRYSLGTLSAVTLLAAAAGWIVAGRVLRPVHRAFEEQRQFIANAGHELRTPLTVMRTAVDVVLAKPQPTREELLDMGHDVRTAVWHAQALIDALLTLARTDQGQINRETVDLATVTEDAIDAAAPAPGAARLHTSLESAPTRGDPILLERLATNLIDNAIRYNVPGGSVWITTSRRDGHVVLTVDNTGPPVASESVDKLFEPFWRLRGRTGDGGFGLGLAIVASIAAAHGGRANAGVRHGGGLTVMVSLPGYDARLHTTPKMPAITQ